MIDSFIKKVNEFHTAFGIKELNVELRYKLFQEELEEYIEGMDARDKRLEHFTTDKGDYVHTETYILDAVCDMFYILAGTYDLHKCGHDVNYKTLKLSEDDLIKSILTLNNAYLSSGDAQDLDYLSNYLYNLAVLNNYQDIIEEAFSIVHSSNMSKLDENGKPIVNGENGVFDETRPLGKVLKSDRFYEPTEQLRKLLDEKNS